MMIFTSPYRLGEYHHDACSIFSYNPQCHPILYNYLESFFTPGKYLLRVCFENPFTRMISSLKYKCPLPWEPFGCMKQFICSCLLLHVYHGYKNRHVFIDIFQTEHFSAVKFVMSYYKNMSFLVIPKSLKF